MACRRRSENQPSLEAPMSWLALTLVAFLCFVLVFFVKNRQLNHPALQYPYRLKDPVFSPAERELFEMLQRTVGQTYLILPKVGVAEVVQQKQHRVQVTLNDFGCKRGVGRQTCPPEKVNIPPAGTDL